MKGKKYIDSGRHTKRIRKRRRTRNVRVGQFTNCESTLFWAELDIGNEEHETKGCKKETIVLTKGV